MTIADLIEHEHLARRAPRPLLYSHIWSNSSPSPFYRPWSDALNVDAEMKFAEYRGATAIRFRMSDGSLVIVRRKTK